MTAIEAKQRIYEQALKGTAVNPGLPSALANLLVAQSQHETGNYTSNAFVKHNNAFGYAYVKGGKYQTGAGLIADNNRPVANYASVEDSTKEVVDWIYRRQKENKFPADLKTITTPEQYATLLKKANYYGDTLNNYLAGLKSFFVNNPGLMAAGTGLILLSAVIFLIIYFTRSTKIKLYES